MTRRESRVRCLSAVCLALSLFPPFATGADAQRTESTQIPIPTVPVVKHVLGNGLTVLISEDHSSPIAAVTVWYHVGSKNEKPGRTGFAHFFEHMMFTGSQNIPTGDHPRILESIGGGLNGTTNADRTLYYDIVPSNELETALWLESDRMGYLPQAMTQERLDAQRGIVQNERRQGVDNQPFGLSQEVVLAAVFPSDNPYSWPVIGSLKDLQAASMADVIEFFKSYYAPNNAIISIVGDIDPVKTKALVEKYFADVPRGPAIERPSVAAVTLQSEKRLVLEDSRARTAQMRMSWPTIGSTHPDRHALATLASVLTLDRTSRLTKLLVYDRQLATSVFAGSGTFENAGIFNINIVPRPTASLTEIEQLVDSVIAGVGTAPPSTKEVARARNYRTVNMITGLQSDLNKSITLADGESTFGDPLAPFKQLREYAAVTPADVQRVAKTYLTSSRVVLSMIPAGKLEMVSKPSLAFTNVTPAGGPKP